ncbi:MAG TPA: carboxypeptidase-like regulatory domain-containing protein [Candidatus Sulfotelmatobacter sp.]|jgi:hypothetical protein|nr:carboxypeptidase-like regulatory domain-containing protein [Candidatus Sulfotelmatobacter sp.]
MKAWWIAGLFLVCAPLLGAQASAAPDLTGFTRSSTERMVNPNIHPIAEPFQVSSVSGTISAERSGVALAEVLFEIRGPGTEKKIRRGRTDKHGHFKISHVPQGTYLFKATLDGFQSVVGTIVVSNARGAVGEIAIHMSIGA